ncbi:ribosomal protein L22 [Thozetella sp. PMI_491]|nr:ribosomal protein L22 [Thozetella sp. PMI_491]
MSANLPSRRLVQGASRLARAPSATPNGLLPALQALTLTPSSTQSSRAFHNTPSKSWIFGRKKKDETVEFAKELTGTKDERKKLMDRLKPTGLDSSSIFADEVNAASQGTPEGQTDAAGSQLEGPWSSLLPAHTARAVDPDPRSRVRWERKMVIRRVHLGTDPFSKESRASRIARTEREILSRSPFLATSVKKLVMLARQIQGKTLEDALVQMRYSKKKMAAEVKLQLELARDQAVVQRGMGLGKVTGEVLAEGDEISIQTKDGKHLKIADPTRMYVAEAWVNRGPWRGKEPDYRARGRAFMKMKPSTSISIVLKEEKTRIRQHQEQVAKKFNQGPWVHLPDRPVTAQRPYYSW